MQNIQQAQARKSAEGGQALRGAGSDFLDFFFGSFLFYQEKRNEQPCPTAIKTPVTN
ncbi:MAG: hypothetical protein ACPGJS_05915 [Flammeovirgaceae bacterium]